MRRSAILSQDERGLAGGRLLQLIDERNIDFDRRGNPYAGVREQCCLVGTGKAGPHHGPDGHRIGGALHKLNLYDVSDFLRRMPDGLDIQEYHAFRGHQPAVDPTADAGEGKQVKRNPLQIAGAGVQAQGRGCF